VLDPHDLWDARDGLLPEVEAVAPALEAARPALTQTATALRPAHAEEPRTTIQLGAFSSRAAAERAWRRARERMSGAAGLSPVFQTVAVNGREFTRLKVGPLPVAAAARLCRAAEVSDPWCANPA
jgi:cell division septation protein DedD